MIYLVLTAALALIVGFIVGFKTAVHITKTRILPEQGYHIKDGRIQPL